VRDAPRHTFLLTFARRGEEAAIREAFAALTERHPGAQVHAVGTPVSEPVLRQLGLERVLIYQRGKHPGRMLEEAQLCMPEAVAIVYGGEDFRGHLKLEYLALRIGAHQILRCREGQPAVRLSRGRLAGVVLGKTCHLALRVALGMAVALVVCAALCLIGRGGGSRARRP